MILEKGNKYNVLVPGDDPAQVEITGITSELVTFSATGATVVDPSKPRELPIGVFTSWLEKTIILGTTEEAQAAPQEVVRDNPGSFRRHN